MGKGMNIFTKRRKLRFKKENVAEDRVIKSLEKKLGISKRPTKSIPKSFVSDGLDYLLDICDEETRKVAAKSEKRLVLKSNSDESDDSDNSIKVKTKSKSTGKRKASVNCNTVKVLKRKKNISESSSESNYEFKSDNESNVDSDDSKNLQNISISKCKKSFVEPHSKNKQSNVQSNSSSESTYDSDISYSDNLNVSKNIKSKKSKIDQKNIKVSAKNNDNLKVRGQNNIAKKSDVAKNKKNLTNIKKKNESVKASLNDKSNESDIDDLEDVESLTSENEGLWEDIYGRKRNKEGDIVSEKNGKYIAPALRLKNLENNPEKTEKLMILKRQVKGLLNRLAERNMHTIVSQLEDLYMSNSRNDMNEMISKLMMESIITGVLTAERLVAEHMMCIAILHANVGTEIGAHFIMILVKNFNDMIQQSQNVENKELDNLVLMMSHLYNFKVFGSQLIYQILDKLVNKFTEKEIEIILLILKTAGFRLRKDDPLALKELILNLQQKATKTTSSNTRINFMLDVLLAIKNNNMNKIPQYDPSLVEHLKKVLKTLIRKGNTISQLNFSLEDLLNADEKGKWWIVGSAWAGKSLPNNNTTKVFDNAPVYSQKILDLARKQKMNTDIRKNIFCILMTAEDYLDAFEKLHHLGLKNRQEREIIYVILNCCLQEKSFNPYYCVLLQKFCDYDRKYQLTIQYTLWDKFKMLDSYNTKQISNMAKLMSYLFINKALPLSVLKVIQLGELDALTMKFFKKIMLDILLHENAETCLEVFERIAPSTKLQHFREGLRLFINYFLLKNLKKETLLPKQVQLLKKRVELVDKILTTSTSKVSF